MYRRFLGGIVFLLMFVQTISAAVVPIAVLSRIDNENGNVAMGSGTVISCKNGKSIVVTAGHLFTDKIVGIQVYGKEAKLLYTKSPKIATTNEEDIAILEVEANWIPLWKLEKEVDKELIKCSGYLFASDKLPITTSGLCNSNKHLAKECIVVPGMSGGPVLAIRNGKHVYIGVISGNTTKNCILTIMGDVQIKTAETGNAYYTGEELIRKRLNEFAPGWDK